MNSSEQVEKNIAPYVIHICFRFFIIVCIGDDCAFRGLIVNLIFGHNLITKQIQQRTVRFG